MYYIISDVKMTVSDVIRQMEPQVFEKWKMIAALLGLYNHVGRISNEFRDKPDECFLAVVQLWENNDHPPFTWRTIIDILQHENVAKKGVAEKIFDHLQEKS